MVPPHENDLLSFLAAAQKWTGSELALSELQDGDRLLVRTRNTSYLLAMTGPHAAVLTSDRADRPRGPVQIRGCVFGQSGIIKPDHLFCGGGLEIIAEDGSLTHTTTAIEAMQLVKFSAGTGPA